jgi:hypothetical protein
METGFRQELSSSLPTSPVRHTDTSQNNRSSETTSDQEKNVAAREAAAQRQEEQRLVQQLAARDREVRAHEAAHVAVGRQYVVSGPNYTYQQGPNGRNYAIGGEVQLDVSEEAEPQATLTKAEVVRRAALAPAEPSPQDRMVAARATEMAAQARVAIATERREMADRQSSEATASVREFSSGNQADVAHQVNVFA